MCWLMLPFFLGFNSNSDTGIQHVELSMKAIPAARAWSSFHEFSTWVVINNDITRPQGVRWHTCCVFARGKEHYVMENGRIHFITDAFSESFLFFHSSLKPVHFATYAGQQEDALRPLRGHWRAWRPSCGGRVPLCAAGAADATVGPLRCVDALLPVALLEKDMEEYAEGEACTGLGTPWNQLQSGHISL